MFTFVRMIHKFCHVDHFNKIVESTSAKIYFFKKQKELLYQKYKSVRLYTIKNNKLEAISTFDVDATCIPLKRGFFLAHINKITLLETYS